MQPPQNKTQSSQTPKIELLLEEVVKKDASDLHLQVGMPPMLRIDGGLIAHGQTPLDEKTLEELVFSLLDQDQKQVLLRDKEFDFRLTGNKPGILLQ
jgi:twitching motility protein PilT